MTVHHAYKAECQIPIGSLGERWAELRLKEADSLEAMRRSLQHHGQLTAIVVFADGAQMEILDGFKRAHAARTLGWTELCAKKADVTAAEAKVQMVVLHDRRGLTEIEEGWLVRSLYRDDGLSQPEIARRLGRHKSWVCRRLMLVEALDPAVQAELRLGLLTARAACSLAQLPRGNQRPASQVVIQRGLTVHQTELLVGQILEQPSETARTEFIARSLLVAPQAPSPSPSRSQRSEADWMATDIATLLRVAGRLQARLMGTPFRAFASSGAQVLFDGLVSLAPVVASLGRTIATVTGKEHTT